MLTPMGKKLGANFGLRPDEQRGLFHGMLGNHQVVVIENTSDRQYSVLFPAKVAEGSPMQGPEDFLSSFAEGRKDIVRTAAGGYVLNVVIRMQSLKKTTESLRQVFDAVVPYLQENHFVSCCMRCGETDAAQNALYVLTGHCEYLCSGCYETVEGELSDIAKENALVKSKLGRGLLGAFLGSLIGVVVWVLINRLGYVAAIAGLVLIFCALKGYEKFGGKIDVKGVVATILLSAVMLVAAQCICYGFDIYEIYGGDGFSYFECLYALPAFLEDPSIMIGFVRDLVIGALFLFGGGVTAIINAYRSHNPNLKVQRIS